MSDLSIVIWGTYDLSKPRTRLLVDQLRRQIGTVIEIHADIWSGIDDKSTIRGTHQKLGLLLRWLFAYPRLVWRYLRTQKHDAVVILYMGHVDVLMIRPWARLRGVPIVWDVVVTMYETLVDDRAMLRSNSLAGRLTWRWDRCALRAADRAVLLTNARRDVTAERYALPAHRFAVVPLGAEADAFPAVTPTPPAEPERLRILFYAQFAPMHGLDRVIAAARLCRDRPFDWRFIGRGQEGWRLEEWIAEAEPPGVSWVEGVAYSALIDEMAAADVCLGLFGTSTKAETAAPNKLFQILAAGRGLVTKGTTGIREILGGDWPGIYLVDDDTPEALTAALDKAWNERALLRDGPLHSALRVRFAPEAIGRAFATTVAGAVADAPRKADRQGRR
ncbi:MAG: glycosyltransferase [Alphaproteobacteria bacterium]|nr:glycosyltransferase [Alphaproteobacteria bacterium]